MFFEILLCVLVVILIVFLTNRKPGGMPPGEWGLPIVGYLPFMEWKLTKTLKKLEAKHGPIFTLKLGSVVFIIISDFTLMKIALSKSEVSGRCSFHSFDILRKYKKLGLLHSDKDIWSTNRKFALKTLKHFGFGQSVLQEIIHTEAMNLVKELKKEVDKPYKIDWSLNVAILNIIWGLVANRRYDTNDEEIKEFTHMVNNTIRDANGPIVLFNIFPFLMAITPTFIKNAWIKENRIQERQDQLYTFFLNIIEDHKKTVDRSKPRDYIDAYLIEKENQKDNKEYSHFGDHDLLVELMDIFLAGSDTTASTLRWFFLYMAKHQDIQRRVQKEIDQVLSRDNIPTMQDKPNLPCLEALTYEISRIISLSPIAIPHRVTEDITLNGFHLPKESVVIPYVEFCHNDPKYWKHPKEFSLQNFLDDEGKFLPPKEGFAPFSLGRRQCAGEPLAKTELFIFVGAILQNFSISEPEGQSVSLEPIEIVFQFNHPQPFEVILRNR